MQLLEQLLFDLVLGMKLESEPFELDRTRRRVRTGIVAAAAACLEFVLVHETIVVGLRMVRAYQNDPDLALDLESHELEKFPHFLKQTRICGEI